MGLVADLLEEKVAVWIIWQEPVPTRNRQCVKGVGKNHDAENPNGGMREPAHLAIVFGHQLVTNQQGDTTDNDDH